MTRLLVVLSTGACHRSLGTPRDVWGVCNVYRAAPAWLVEGRCPSRSKKVLVDRLEALGEGVRSIEAVVIDPYAGYKAAVRDAAPRATRVADHFHIVGLANAALTDVRTRRQQEITGHRGRKGDPLWSVRHDLLRAREHRACARTWDFGLLASVWRSRYQQAAGGEVVGVGEAVGCAA